LWLNTATNGFQPAPADTLPVLSVSVGAAVTADFDGDGRPDVFIGGRVSPGEYPRAPRSALWLNRGGRFEDATGAFAPDLAAIGLATAAVATDLDADGWTDLLVALEWGQVRYCRNRSGTGFEDRTEAAGFAAAGTGWWRALAAADFNGDGQPDIVA